MLNIPDLRNTIYHVVKNAGADERGRVTLGNDAKNTRFRIFKTSKGQYILDPVVEVSTSELQLLSDPAEKALFDEAVQQAKDSSKLRDLGSFSQYVG
ncbi:hypothetical protein [Trichocoleus sp. FACHB-262]|uniref:hypothetical protein n=1 Tax=Trichocoleus sp. FACHB-262 TaxID=2692869 RepID=UPI0016836435|nr:hypothetical protein [Trichocoleus sp. FACHB-262]MBD2120192.1 hypothetical protein [Trichocoleus sp. FACHB-262]